MCNFLNLNAQVLSPEYRVEATLDYENKTISGTCNIKVQTSMSTLKIKLTTNAYRSQQTSFAKDVLQYESDFYFYKEEEYGGYTKLAVTANGQNIPVDFQEEILSIDMPANGTDKHELTISFEQKIPKQLYSMGWDKHYVALVEWYPVLAYHDGKKWYDEPLRRNYFRTEAFGSHHGFLKVSGPYQVLSSYLSENGDSTLYQFKLNGKSPALVVTGKDKIMEIPVGKDGKKVFVFHRKNKLKNKRKANLRRVFSSEILLLEKTLPSLDFDNYFFGNNNVTKKYFLNYFLSGVFDNYFTNHFHVQPDQIWFSTVLEWKYMQYFFSTLPGVKKNNQKIDDKYYNCENFRNVFPFMDFNGLSDGFMQNDLDERHKFCVNNGIGLSVFYNLENYFGKDSLFVLTGKYLAQQFHHEISMDGFIHFLSAETGKDFMPFYQSHLNPESRPNYEITETKIQNDSIIMTIENKGVSAVPFMLIEKSASGEKIYWKDGLSGTRTITIPGRLDYNEGIVTVKLDPNRYLRESSRQNHMVILTPENSGQSRKIEIEDIPFIPKRLSVRPLLAFNTTNGIMVGINAENKKSITLKGFEYDLMPLFATRTSNFAGDGWLAWNYMKSKKFDNIRLEGLVKKYDYSTQDSLDYHESYFKFQPSLTFFKGQVYEKVRSELRFRPIFFWNRVGNYVDRNYVGLTTEFLQIYLVEYKKVKTHSLGKTEWYAALEYQPYKSPFGEREQYAKASASIQKYFSYNAQNKISVRVFGSVFLFNSQKNSNSYNTVFARGSIPLFQQAINDYRYDGYFFDRAGTSSFFSRQTAFEQDGGFKQTPDPALNFGMSNRYVFSSNVIIDLPFRNFDYFKLYADVGMYGAAFGENKILYTGGVMFTLERAIQVFYPLVQSQDLDFVTGNTFWTWKKLSFHIDIDGLRKSL
jgi:hypothetical protein